MESQSSARVQRRAYVGVLAFTATVLIGCVLLIWAINTSSGPLVWITVLLIAVVLTVIYWVLMRPVHRLSPDDVYRALNDE